MFSVTYEVRFGAGRFTQKLVRIDFGLGDFSDTFEAPLGLRDFLRDI